VGLAAVNVDTQPHALSGLGIAQTWTLAPAPGQPIDTKIVTVNGARPGLLPNGRLAGLAPRAITGSVAVPARSIVFVAMRSAANPACR
jgi:hypothetical protein